MRATFAAAIQGALREALQDPSVRLFGDGIVAGESVTTRGLAALFPDQVQDLPISDRASAAFCLGLALGGQRPILEVSSLGRLAAMMEVLVEAGAIAQAGEFPANVTFRVAYGGQAGSAIDTPLLASLADIPGLTIACADSPTQAAALVRAALQARGPVVLLESRALYNTSETVSEANHPLFALRSVREGSHISLIGWGESVSASMDAALCLEKEGYSAEVLDLSTLSPVDSKTLGQHVRQTGRVVVVCPTDLSFGARLTSVVLAEGFEYLEAPPVAVLSNPSAVLAASRSALTF